LNGLNSIHFLPGLAIQTTGSGRKEKKGVSITHTEEAEIERQTGNGNRKLRQGAQKEVKIQEMAERPGEQSQPRITDCRKRLRTEEDKTNEKRVQPSIGKKDRPLRRKV